MIFFCSYLRLIILKKSLPIVAISDIDTIKIEKLYNYFVINNIILKMFYLLVINLIAKKMKI